MSLAHLDNQTNILSVYLEEISLCTLWFFRLLVLYTLRYSLIGFSDTPNFKFRWKSCNNQSSVKYILILKNIQIMSKVYRYWIRVSPAALWVCAWTLKDAQILIALLLINTFSCLLCWTINCTLAANLIKLRKTN